MKILIVALYFPPAGGAGVQRPLKFAEHLPELGFETHVLAPDDPKWLDRDESQPLPPRAVIHRAKNLGPKARRPGEELYRLRGPERLGAQARLAFRRQLVPDASVLWNATAIPAAVRIVRREGIDVVLTTSPPGSIHLVGAAAKRVTGVRWVADLRDSIAAHPHRRRAVRGERSLARLVARRADAITCASEAIAGEMRKLVPAARVEVIENGCDFEDFAGLPYTPAPRLRITHTGRFFGRRNPRPFLEALSRGPEDVVARFVGDFRRADREYAESLGLGDRLELVPSVPRAQALALQRDSEALLLLIPEAEGRGRGVLSGKVFEYLAAERPILAAVPPEGAAARLLEEVGTATIVAPDDVEGLTAALSDLERRWRAGELDGAPLSEDSRRRLSRRARVEELAELLRSLA
jgi:glycosyltransferase involved in cell wall biosynthesis